MARTSKPWFAPKRSGYGAALPVSWEGWAVLLVFVIGMGGAVAGLHGHGRDAGVMGLIIVLVIVMAAKTDGGWRWRSGDHP